MGDFYLEQLRDWALSQGRLAIELPTGVAGVISPIGRVELLHEFYPAAPTDSLSFALERRRESEVPREWWTWLEYSNGFRLFHGLISVYGVMPRLLDRKKIDWCFDAITESRDSGCELERDQLIIGRVGRDRLLIVQSSSDNRVSIMSADGGAVFSFDCLEDAITYYVQQCHRSPV